MLSLSQEQHAAWHLLPKRHDQPFRDALESRGYWRGRINRHSQFQQETIADTLNKTYTMQLYYDNPDSPWVAGFGRLHLPWAVSLDTIDGGRRFNHNVTAGIFGGSSLGYHPLIADDRRSVTANGIRLAAAIGRRYLTIHLDPSQRLYFHIYHNYFRDVPTAATTIVGTGLVDKLLFQGLNVGFHVQPIRHIML